MNANANARLPILTLLLLHAACSGESGAGGETGAETGAETGTGTGAETETETGTGAETGTGTGAGAETETETGTGAETGAGAETGETGTGAGAETGETGSVTPTVPVGPPDQNEACGQMLVVAYQGAKFADPKVTRDKAAAKARAEELLATYKKIGDFDGLARVESDAPTSAARGGIMGTHAKADWPELHAALRDPLFALQLHAVADAPIEAPYGYVLLRRCVVEKARSRHILVRYAGAKSAEEQVTRTKDEARARAQELLAKLAGGADFATLARSDSEDGSAERGGDIGSRGRGVLSQAYEDSLFGLKAGERSGVVESEFGFHIIERLPE